MSMRTRKLIGLFALFILVIVWSLLAMAIAQAPFIPKNEFARLIYHALAGLGWIFPAMPIIKWMARPDRQD